MGKEKGEGQYRSRGLGSRHYWVNSKLQGYTVQQREYHKYFITMNGV